MPDSLPMDPSLQRLEDTLAAVLDRLGPIAVAASGGVDSMTLAWFAHRHAPSSVAVFHALSPAVPTIATDRVRDYAHREGWRLELIDAGEFADPAYRANPVDRCFYCKHNLYATIASRTDATVVSGTNLDDLGDYRPGLRAAEQHGVHHPYVAAGIDKQGVRALARRHGLFDLAELPAAPCLASRVETGIRIEAADLGFVDRVETLLRDALLPQTARCRLRHDGVVIELDEAALARVESRDGDAVRSRVDALCRARGLAAVRYECYRRGSAFVQP